MKVITTEKSGHDPKWLPDIGSYFVVEDEDGYRNGPLMRMPSPEMCTGSNNIHAIYIIGGHRDEFTPDENFHPWYGTIEVIQGG